MRRGKRMKQKRQDFHTPGEKQELASKERVSSKSKVAESTHETEGVKRWLASTIPLLKRP